MDTSFSYAKYFLALLFLFNQSCLLHSQSVADIQIIKNRVVSELMSATVDAEEISDLIVSLQPGGTWPGINYQDVSRTGFQHGQHLGNLVDLSLAFVKEGSPYYQNENLKSSIDKALNYWLVNDFICENWWWNQIGTPRYLVQVMLLLDQQHLSAQQIEKLLPIVGRAHLEASGARPSGDRIKIAGILAKKLLFMQDQQQFDEVIEVIENEIKFATGRGMQYDFSFHHRVDRVNNTLSYGMGYASAFAEWAAYVAGTSYAFSEEKINQLIDYYLDGIAKMMVFGKYPDLAAKNRSISRLSALKAVSEHVPQKLLTTTDYRREEMEQIIAGRENQKAVNASFSKFFWHSEYHSHQRPGFFTSVRMYSTRNRSMEVPYNKEGLKNHYLGDGANYIYTEGDEYFDIFPVWDWQKIPGSTIVQKPQLPSAEEVQQEGKTEFVGGVTDGLYGAAVFDFDSPLDDLQAKKSWFFFDQAYVCLGAGIRSGEDYPVVTTINQALLDGAVVADNQELKRGVHSLEGVQWVHHDQVAYIFPETVDAQLENTTRRGSWFDISKQSDTPREPVEKDIFLLYLSHGPTPGNASYAYVVKPNIAADKVENCHKNLPLQILKNNENLQAVRHSHLDLVQVVFYQPGSVKLTHSLTLTAEEPLMVMIQLEGEAIKKITVADPSRKLNAANVKVNAPLQLSGNDLQYTWDEEKKVSHLSIALPRGVFAGKSIVLE